MDGNVQDLVARDSAASTLFLLGNPSNGPLISIRDASGRELVRIALVDGRMTAEYDPEDLDEAARRFWDVIASMVPVAWTSR